MIPFNTHKSPVNEIKNPKNRRIPRIFNGTSVSPKKNRLAVAAMMVTWTLAPLRLSIPAWIFLFFAAKRY